MNLKDPDELRKWIDPDVLIDNGYDGIVSVDEDDERVILQNENGMHENFAIRNDAPASWYIPTRDGRFLEFVSSV
jgi:hypothetical protein